MAAPNYAGIPLTHREHCSSFTVFTGHSDSADAATALRYEQIAKIPGTKVVLMGTDNLDDWTKSLIAHGMSPETPVAIIQWGTLGRQKSVAGTLATIAALAAKEKISPPALTIVGDVVKLRGKVELVGAPPVVWEKDSRHASLGRTPGRRPQISGTAARRPSPNGSRSWARMSSKCRRSKSRHRTTGRRIIDALLELNSYDWLVFTSANGVTAFFDLFFKRFQDLRDIGGARIAAVGPATAAKLRELHLQVDLTPEAATAQKAGRGVREIPVR